MDRRVIVERFTKPRLFNIAHSNTFLDIGEVHISPQENSRLADLAVQESGGAHTPIVRSLLSDRTGCGLDGRQAREASFLAHGDVSSAEIQVCELNKREMLLQ